MTPTEKYEAVRAAEAQRLVADSLVVRRAILDRVQRGEISLEAGQAELRRVKRSAVSRGLRTRASVYRDGV